MLNYLSKFVLQMLPTISATVIGAYIVATWINPKTPQAPAKMTAQAQPDAKATKTSGGDVATAPDQAKAGDADARSVEAANGPDGVRIIPIVKQPTPSSNDSSSAVEAEPAIDERKDVNQLARAAIERLRGGSETGRRAAEQPAKAPAARHQQARVAAEPAQALPAATVAPPLPPAISVAAPRYPHTEDMDPAASDLPDRLTPPGEIPVSRNPLNLQASHRIAENPSPADDFLLATKSFFRAIAPH